MELVATPVGIISFGILAVLYVLFSRHTPLGALSLPCMVLLTSMVYFYVMPAMALNGAETGFLGVYINSLEGVHLAVLLYALGASFALLISRQSSVDPGELRASERPLGPGFLLVLAIAAAGLATLVLTNRLNVAGDEDFELNEASGQLAFLQLSISMLLPVVVVYTVRENFGVRALAAIALALVIFLQSGFRFRIAILMIALAVSFSVLRGFRMGVVAVAAGTTLSLILFNALGAGRKYGIGFDFSLIQDASWTELLNAFGGEVGPIFAFYSVIEYPPAELATVQPWTVAIARLVPSFIWPDKPQPDYLTHYTILFDDRYRTSAGIAAPQQAEILLQFGWPGLPLVAFAYFALVGLIILRINKLGREARIAGMALVPGVFGFYMQQRGYFFQTLAEALFIIGPLFVMHSRTATLTAANRLANWQKGREPGPTHRSRKRAP